MIYTTLNEIHSFGLSKLNFVKLLAHLGKMEADDEPFPLVTVLDVNGPYDVICCLRAYPDVAATFANWCAYEAATSATSAAYWADDSARGAGLVVERQIAKLRELLS